MTTPITDYPQYFQPYVALSRIGDAKILLAASLPILEQTLRTIPNTKANYTYAPEKWTVKQVLQHCIDAERIFAYRALCHGRGELQPLPGFDEKEYAATADLKHRALESLIAEFIIVRKASIALFESLTHEDLNRIGVSGTEAIKTKSWAYIIIGHWVHHQNILKERYGL